MVAFSYLASRSAIDIGSTTAAAEMAAAVTELQSHYQGLQPPEGTDFVAVITDGSSHDKDEGKHTLGPRSTGTTGELSSAFCQVDTPGDIDWLCITTVLTANN